MLIAGFGYVGKAVKEIFPECDVYDPKIADFSSLSRQKFGVCFVCVPTPAGEDGSCNTSEVEKALREINADLFIIRSTIPPGTTDRLEKKHKKNIVFQPEYIASSSPYPAPLGDLKTRTFIILGGRPESTKKARRIYERIYPPTAIIYEVDAITAEVIKYGENSFIATKVTFCNELYDICRAFKVDYDKVREGVFRLDPRMTEWWTYVRTDQRGWGGHCLPKDLSAIVAACKKAGINPQFIKDVIANNSRHKKINENAPCKTAR